MLYKIIRIPRLGLILLLLIINSSLYSQNSITGIVKDSAEGIVLPFSTVILLKNDTIYSSTITDLKGKYTFNDIKNSLYEIKCSYIGYNDYSEEVVLNGDLIKNINLLSNIEKIDEVEVVSSRVVSDIEKTSFIISDDEKEKAKSSLDLINSLNTVDVNLLEKKISSKNGGKVKVLINGVASYENEILTYSPNDIIRIEEYIFPPSKYSGYDAVINVVVKERYKGGGVGIDLLNSFSTGFGNDDIYYKTNFDKHRLSISYRINYREYENRQINESYKYNLNDIEYSKKIKGENSPFGYKDHSLNLSYSYKSDSVTVFQVKAYSGLLDRHSIENSVVSNIINEDTVTGYRNNKAFDDRLSSSVDLYYFRRFKDKSELAINVVGTGYSNKQELSSYEYKINNIILLYDSVNLENTKQSIISQIDYSKAYDRIKANIGFRHYSGLSTNNVFSSFNTNKYKMANNSEVFYLDLLSKYKGINIKASLIGSYNSFNEDLSDSKYDYWSIQPQLALDYSINKFNNIKLLYTTAVQTPSLSQLAENKYFIIENLISVGNSDLSPYRVHVWGVNYLFTYNNISLNVNPIYIYSPNFISEYFYIEDNSIYKSYVNQKKTKAYEINYDFSVAFFNKKIKFKTYGHVGQTNHISHSNKEINYFNVNSSFKLNYYPHKLIEVFGVYSTTFYELTDGLYLYTPENFALLGISFGSGNLSFSINLFHPFYDSWERKYKTIENDIIENVGQTNIYDNGNMVTFKLIMRFSYGKENGGFKRSIFNSDKDYGGINK